MNFSLKSTDKDTSTLDRYKNGNGYGSKNVLFAPNVENSLSSYSLNEQIHLNSNHQNAATTVASTSQRIKQTLSPLSTNRFKENNSSSTPKVSSGVFLSSSKQKLIETLMHQ